MKQKTCLDEGRRRALAVHFWRKRSLLTKINFGNIRESAHRGEEARDKSETQREVHSERYLFVLRLRI
jgi:hypothetical protein